MKEKLTKSYRSVLERLNVFKQQNLEGINKNKTYITLCIFKSALFYRVIKIATAKHAMMHWSVFKSCVLLAAFAGFAACDKNNQPPKPPTPVGEVSFKEDVIPIFNASCNTAGCHNGSIAPNLQENVAHTNLIGGGYINLATPENSELYQWMLGNRSMPMPLEGSNPSYNATILAWINQGALNN
jgi:hypothetical protein